MALFIRNQGVNRNIPYKDGNYILVVGDTLQEQVPLAVRTSVFYQNLVKMKKITYIEKNDSKQPDTQASSKVEQKKQPDTQATSKVDASNDSSNKGVKNG